MQNDKKKKYCEENELKPSIKQADELIVTGSSESPIIGVVIMLIFNKIFIIIL